MAELDSGVRDRRDRGRIGRFVLAVVLFSAILGTTIVTAPKAAAGGNGVPAVSSSTTLTAWGDDSCGEARLPQRTEPAIAVAAGWGTSIALRDDHTVVAWGRNGSGQANVPVGLKDVTGVEAGEFHSLALLGDGTVVAWGGHYYVEDYGQTRVPDGLADVQEIAVGSEHNLALKNDGTVVAWGRNDSGQTNVPSGLTDVISIAAGGSRDGSNISSLRPGHSLALKNDGTVIAWGNNSWGQTDVPSGLTGVTAIAAGYAHSLALKNDGSVVAWGNDFFGQATVPPGMTDVVAIAARGEHNLALKSDGTVIAWGEHASVPDGLTGVTAIAAGRDHNLAVKGDGSVVGWGENRCGETSAPSELADVASIAAGAGYSLALKNDGTVVIWGSNEFGQASAPPELAAVTGIAAGLGHNLALKNDGTVVAWGWNRFDQASVPPGLTDVAAIAAGGEHSLALTTDGTVVAWGNDAFGQTNLPEGLSGVTAIAAGYYHSLALKNDGTVVAWGDDSLGQASVPAGLSGVIAIAGGSSHSLALKNDGSVVAWGGNDLGQTSVPPGLSGVTMIAVGAQGEHSLALKEDGTVVAWGSNLCGQTNVPGGLTGVSTIAAGGSHSLALSGTVSELAVTGISITQGGNTGSVTVSIFGREFSDNVVAKLVRTGETAIVGATKNVTISSTGLSSVRTTFNLVGKPEGSWDVVVTNPDGNSAILPGAFSVVSTGAGGPLLQNVLSLQLVGPSQVRAQRDATYYALVRNEGLIDINAAQLQVTAARRDPSEPPNPNAELPPDAARVYIEHVLGEDIDMLAPYSSKVIPFDFNVGDAGKCADFRGYAIAPTFGLPMVGPFTVNSNFGERPDPFEPDKLDNHEGMDLAYADALLKSHAPIVAMQAGKVTEVTTGSSGLKWVTIDHEGGYKSRYLHLSAFAVSRNEYVSAGSVIGYEGNTGLSTGDHLHWEVWENGKRIDPRVWAADHGLGLPEKGKTGYPEGGPLGADSGLSSCAVGSMDPNEKIGPEGSGDQRFLRADSPMPYTILFENKPDATAPAQDVVISDQLDPAKIDLDTFMLRRITFGDHTVAPPDSVSEFTTDVDLRPANNLVVRINAGLDKSTGLLTWRFTSIDPETGRPPTDAMAGFLPPNMTSPEGEGSVSFTVEPRRGLPTGTELRNQARIVFDTNDPIDTPIWVNTVDLDRPTSEVLRLPATQQAASFEVQWAGTDMNSGVKDYTVYVSEDNGPYRAWLSNTTDAAATFSGQANRAYSFFSIARDGAGNSEEAPTEPDTRTVTLEDHTVPVITPFLFGTLGSHDWYSSDILLVWDTTDYESNVTTTDGCGPTSITEDTLGATLTCTATSAGGATSGSVTVKRDATKPTAVWNEAGPTDQGTYPEGQVPPAPTCSDAASGVADCAVTGHDTSVGTHTVSVTARDNAGNTTTEARSYTVSAVNDPPVVQYTVLPLYKLDKANKVGSTVPIKIQVHESGKNASKAGMSVQAVSLTMSASTIKPVPGSGKSQPEGNFTFDPTLGDGGGYQFNVKTTGLTPGTWTLKFTIGDEQKPHGTTFIVRK